MTDTHNSLKRHVIVGVVSVIVGVAMNFSGFHYQEVAAAVPYFLLFLTVVIAPLLVMVPAIQRRFQGNLPVNWRSELGI